MKITIASNYSERRREEYPPLTELADALFHAEANGDRSKLDAYLDAVAKVKERFPKPSVSPEPSIK